MSYYIYALPLVFAEVVALHTPVGDYVAAALPKDARTERQIYCTAEADRQGRAYFDLCVRGGH